MRRALPLVLLLLLLAPAALAEGDAGPVDLNSASRERIAGLPGVSDELAAFIVKWREEHGAFETEQEVQNVPGITAPIWAAIETRVRILPPLAMSEDEPRGPAVNLVAVANYFVKFDGVELEELAPEVRRSFLDKVNWEECPCGCVGDSIARCYVNDPGCPVARARLRAVHRQMQERNSDPAPAPE